MNKFTSNYIPVVLFTKILTIDFARKRKFTILFLFTKIKPITNVIGLVLDTSRLFN